MSQMRLFSNLKIEWNLAVSTVPQQVKNLTVTVWVAAKVRVQSLTLHGGLKDPAQIQSLAQEFPYAVGIAI